MGRSWRATAKGVALIKENPQTLPSEIVTRLAYAYDAGGRQTTDTFAEGSATVSYGDGTLRGGTATRTPGSGTLQASTFTWLGDLITRDDHRPSWLVRAEEAPTGENEYEPGGETFGLSTRLGDHAGLRRRVIGLPDA